MALLIDSSVLIAEERGESALQRLLSSRPDEDLAIAAITAAELLHGVHRANASRRPSREAYVEHILATLPVIPFGILAARAYAVLEAELAKAKIPVASHDLSIAATAIAGGRIVATLDRRTFPRIPGLKVAARKLALRAAMANLAARKM